MAMPAPGVRIDRLTEAIDVVTALLGSAPFTLDGVYHRAWEAQSLPSAIQRPHPRVLVGGKGNRLLRVIAEHADGWNTCWTWTPAAYRERLDVLERACEKVGRDPATVWRSLGLYALCGENERDLERRFELMAGHAPPGVMRGVDLPTFREGRLVGTVEEVQEQVAEWQALGVETLIAGVGAVPFHVSGRDDVDMLGHALAS
jgi:alkanesulfonate monooxygenase SsuD/methylene tetrahydromethanopterin reductase-like flavin-dependent oxidoreductase (luciferase family)